MFSCNYLKMATDQDIQTLEDFVHRIEERIELPRPTDNICTLCDRRRVVSGLDVCPRCKRGLEEEREEVYGEHEDYAEWGMNK